MNYIHNYKIFHSCFLQIYPLMWDIMRYSQFGHGGAGQTNGNCHYCMFYKNFLVLFWIGNAIVWFKDQNNVKRYILEVIYSVLALLLLNSLSFLCILSWFLYDYFMHELRTNSFAPCFFFFFKLTCLKYLSLSVHSDFSLVFNTAQYSIVWIWHNLTSLLLMNILVVPMCFSSYK